MMKKKIKKKKGGREKEKKIRIYNFCCILNRGRNDFFFHAVTEKNRELPPSKNRYLHVV
jgi:hypothetical protein